MKGWEKIKKKIEKNEKNDKMLKKRTANEGHHEKKENENKKWHNWKPGKAAASENLTVNDKRRLKRQSVVELIRLGKKGNYMQWWIDWCTVLDQRIGFLLWNLVYHERITMRECL